VQQLEKAKIKRSKTKKKEMEQKINMRSHLENNNNQQITNQQDTLR
jgi:hypothetical protein